MMLLSGVADAAKQYSPKIFSSFQLSLGISRRNWEILRTQAYAYIVILCAHNSDIVSLV